MPWKPDKNGDNKYHVSIYTKEELPTWAEIYEEFYLNRSFIYDPENKDHQSMDLYWKIPKMKYVLAITCNQFNKMIFEDKLRMNIIQFISSEIFSDCCDVRFTCEPIENFDPSKSTDEDLRMDYDAFVSKWKTAIDSKFIGTDMAPPIYTIPLPNGDQNPFITSSHPRINVNTIITPMCLFPVIKFNDGGDNYSIHTPLPYRESSCEDYYKIIDFMMKPLKEYFEGNGIGWKDADGNLIESDPMKHSCDGAGYDPAL